jgi:hypothetical protein
LVPVFAEGAPRRTSTEEGASSPIPQNFGVEASLDVLRVLRICPTGKVGIEGITQSTIKIRGY